MEAERTVKNGSAEIDSRALSLGHQGRQDEKARLGSKREKSSPPVWLRDGKETSGGLVDGHLGSDMISGEQSLCTTGNRRGAAEATCHVSLRKVCRSPNWTYCVPPVWVESGNAG